MRGSPNPRIWPEGGTGQKIIIINYKLEEGTESFGAIYHMFSYPTPLFLHFANVPEQGNECRRK
jgi:hypothetical protein